ncbi:hypothetical protein AKJ16_DCAP20897 [Drosera capensis]
MAFSCIARQRGGHEIYMSYLDDIKADDFHLRFLMDDPSKNSERCGDNGVDSGFPCSSSFDVLQKVEVNQGSRVSTQGVAETRFHQVLPSTTVRVHLLLQPRFKMSTKEEIQVQSEQGMSEGKGVGNVLQILARAYPGTHTSVSQEENTGVICVGPIATAISLNRYFWIFPVDVLGSSSLNNTVFGAILCLQYSTTSFSVGFSSTPSFKLTKAIGVSPQNSSGFATTAASFTTLFVYRTASTSMLFMFSPPLMITSFNLSLISKYPSGCITPTSPVLNHPPSMFLAVASGSFKYPSMMEPPRITISPRVTPSCFTLFFVMRSITSTAVRPGVRTPCRAFSLACSVAGSLFQSFFQVQDTTTPPVSVSPYPWLTENPRDWVRRRIGAGGGAPAVRMWTLSVRGLALGVPESIFRMTGAPHMWVTRCRSMAEKTVAGSGLRIQMLVAPTAAVAHEKLHPLEWNMGRVHR